MLSGRCAYTHPVLQACVLWNQATNWPRVYALQCSTWRTMILWLLRALSRRLQRSLLAAGTLCWSCSTRPATRASWTPSGGATAVAAASAAVVASMLAPSRLLHHRLHDIPLCAVLCCAPKHHCDAPRSFIDAATRYYELSSLSTRSVGGLAVGEDDLLSACPARTLMILHHWHCHV